MASANRKFKYYFGYKGIFHEINRLNAALCIQRNWIQRRYNPEYSLCERVMMRGLAEITNSKIQNEFTYCKNIRKKNFKRDLEITKRVLADLEKKKLITKNRIKIKGKRKQNKN